jgi:hypothetical protein
VIFRELARGVAIFDRYVDERDTVAAAHDELFVCGIAPDKMSADDVSELNDLGWHWGDEDSWEHTT